MKVKVAQSSGFCFGVKRAMDLVLQKALRDNKVEVFTDGPLIHNPQALELLRNKGVVPLIEAKGSIKGIIVIRSHGVSPERFHELKKTGAKILDATCPKVKQVQSIISRYAKQGFFVVIIGDAEHAEVQGLLGFAGENSRVIQSEDELKKLPSQQKICFVAQTTQNRKKYLELKEKIEKRFPQAEIFDTICEANRKRQEELEHLCHAVDAIVVVGGKESGNTKRLVEIAEAEGITTFFGETEEDLDLSRLRSYHEIGVIGGASTPDFVLEKVINKLETSI
ncbi:MAG: 4-hydroxy-3-methylbut-2-enyl diphosphate reductase [Thermodesulfobacteriota bacterium]|jgi:4-hydroxy-3-methylbut-2-enyl diphosphate reductase|nr:MAG: 4-hydroxy-3-methylbut-2-enyl diphosphate reductase [Thermodesulfobacteriota bacterium]